MSTPNASRKRNSDAQDPSGTGRLYGPAAVRGSLLSSLGVLAIAAAVALAVGGCGGSSDSNGGGGESTGSTGGGGKETSGGGKEATGGKETTVQSSSLSRAEFVERAGAICTREKTKGLEEMGAYVKQHPGATGAGKLELIGEALQKVFLPSVQRQIDQIRALGAPAGDEQEIEAFLSALQEAVDEAGQGTPSNGKFGQAFASSANLAHEYGLDACAYG